MVFSVRLQTTYTNYANLGFVVLDDETAKLGPLATVPNAARAWRVVDITLIRLTSLGNRTECQCFLGVSCALPERHGVREISYSTPTLPTSVWLVRRVLKYEHSRLVRVKN
jgi:hypothetical protein